MQPKDRLDPNALQLGRFDNKARPDRTNATGKTTSPSDYQRSSAGPAWNPEVVTLKQQSHLMTFAPAGGDRGRSTIIPNLLTYTGSVVVVDPQGEAYAATADRRRVMGHEVVRLDPFGVIDENSDAINPLEMLSNDGADIDRNGRIVAELFYQDRYFHDDWDNQSLAVCASILAYLSIVPDKANTVSEVGRTFHSDDVVYSFAVVLDTIGKKLPPAAYRQIASWLQLPDADRKRILARIHSRLEPLIDAGVARTIDSSSAPLAELSDTKPLSVFAIMPVARMRQYSPVLRLWIGTVLQWMIHRRPTLAQPVLFMVDDCEQLGTFPLLEQAITSFAGRGLQIWTFWQDVNQLRSLYPAAWQTMVSKCGAIQLFGIKDYVTATEVGALVGIDQADIRSLDADQQVVAVEGVCLTLKRIDT